MVWYKNFCCRILFMFALTILSSATTEKSSNRKEYASTIEKTEGAIQRNRQHW